MRARRLRVGGSPEQMYSRKMQDPLRIQTPYKLLQSEKVLGSTARKFTMLVNLNDRPLRSFNVNHANEMRSLAESLNREMGEKQFFGQDLHNLLGDIAQLRNSGILQFFRTGSALPPDVVRAVQGTYSLLGEINHRLQLAAEERNASR